MKVVHELCTESLSLTFYEEREKTREPGIARKEETVANSVNTVSLCRKILVELNKKVNQRLSGRLVCLSKIIKTKKAQEHLTLSTHKCVLYASSGRWREGKRYQNQLGFAMSALRMITIKMDARTLCRT